MKNIMKYLTLAIGIVVGGLLLLFLVMPFLGGVLKVALFVLVISGIVSFIKKRK